MHLLDRVARGETVAPDSAVDWPALLDEADLEGMTALLAHALRDAEVPRDVKRQLVVRSMAIESRSVTMLRELARIVTAFREHDIRMLAMKGAILSQQLYGDKALRGFSDLDIFVAPEDADRGEELLGTLGYHDPEAPPPGQMSVHRRFNNESLFVHDQKRTLVDFHWEFANVQFPLRLSFEDVWRRRTAVTIDGFDYPTAGDADLVVITANHAAKHLWSRLEHLVQIAALARRELDWNEVDRIATQAGAARQVGVSLLLVHERFAQHLPPAERSLSRARRVYASVRELVAQNVAKGEKRKTDAGGRDVFYLFDRRRDAFLALAVSVFVPTHPDWKSASVPWLSRPMRLARKHWIHRKK